MKRSELNYILTKVAALRASASKQTNSNGAKTASVKAALPNYSIRALAMAKYAAKKEDDKKKKKKEEDDDKKEEGTPWGDYAKGALGAGAIAGLGYGGYKYGPELLNWLKGLFAKRDDSNIGISSPEAPQNLNEKAIRNAVNKSDAVANATGFTVRDVKRKKEYTVNPDNNHNYVKGFNP